MQAESHGSQWDIIMNVLINSDKYMDKNSYAFSSEMASFDFFNKNPDVRIALRQWIVRLNEKRTRSADYTTRLRNGGNQFYAESTKPYDVAADYYTLAIFSAPKDSVELALAHANRAQCFLKMLGFEEEGYRDCELALKYNYPMNKRDKLLERKLFLGSGNVARCEETIREMEELVRKKIFNGKQMKLADHRKHLKALKEQSRSNEERSPSDDEFNNKQIIIKTAECGRYVVAGEDIKKNQSILREKAFAFVPVYNDYHPDTISYHCQNCAQTNCVPFPCYNCVRATYCSPQCVEEHKNIHRYECAGYQKNLWMKIGIAHLSFRNFIIGFTHAIERLDESESTAVQVFEKLMTINEPNFVYGDVLRLVTNFDKMDPDDCLHYALTAELLAIYLDECTDFFKNLPEKCLKIMAVNEWKKFTVAALMRHMGQLVCNGHAIADIELMPPSRYDHSYRTIRSAIMIKDLHLVTTFSRIFTAICPKISMLNHSCQPNIYNGFDGDQLSIYASCDIAKNEEIYNCYGPNFKLMSKLERQSALRQQYCFDCKCEKCTNNDQTDMKYYQYFCTNEDCRSEIVIDSPDPRWWHYIVDEKLMQQIADKFSCKKCKTDLLLNPETLKHFFEITNTENNFELQFHREKRLTKAAIDYYMAVSECLSKYHDLKTFMARALLRYHIGVDDKDIFTQLSYIAIEYTMLARERFSQYSLEFIFASTHALNILKMAKELETDKKSEKLLPEIQKIRKVLDITKISKSYKILSKKMKTMFHNAINEIANVSDQLSQLNLSGDLSNEVLDSESEEFS